MKPLPKPSESQKRSGGKDNDDREMGVCLRGIDGKGLAVHSFVQHGIDFLAIEEVKSVRGGYHLGVDP